MATASEMFMDLQQRRDAAIQKYVYFLLAASAAAMAFSVQRVHGQPIDYSQIPLAGAIAWWAYSFWCGSQHIKKNDNLWVIELLYFDSIVKHGRALDNVAAARNERSEELGAARKLYWDRQLSALLCGGILFATWELGDMILATSATDSEAHAAESVLSVGDIHLLSHERSAPSGSPVLIPVLTIIATISASVGAVLATHRFTKNREVAAYRKTKIEEMFLLGRDLIKDYSEQSLLYLEVFDGKRTANSVAQLLAEEVGGQYAFGKKQPPTLKSDMLVGFHFPTLRPWLDKLESLNCEIIEAVKSHPEPGFKQYPFPRNDESVMYAKGIFSEYARMRLTLLDLLLEESKKLE